MENIALISPHYLQFTGRNIYLFIFTVGCFKIISGIMSETITKIHNNQYVQLYYAELSEAYIIGFSDAVFLHVL